MREIKFRAWNEPEKDMVYSEVMPDMGFWKYVAYDNTTPFMQYTGLKDKNGVEIYEGDILKYQHQKKNKTIDRICTIEYGEESSWPNGHYGWLLCGNTDDGAQYKSLFNQYKLDHCEVIGNIYENPELLK